MSKVLVPLADGCEELEAVTIIDLLRRAGIEVVTAGLRPGIVKASRGVQLVLMSRPTSRCRKTTTRWCCRRNAGRNASEGRCTHHQLLKRWRAGKRTAAICAAPMVLAGQVC
jgi:4-methyl-5(b-hydroxyethyl)-thiazole monophosphate biosynthesis